MAKKKTNNDKELIEKICIILYKKGMACGNVLDYHIKYKNFGTLWGELEASDAFSFLKVINTPKKELRQLAQEIIRRGTKSIESFILDIMNDNFGFGEDIFYGLRDVQDACYDELIIQIDNIDIEEVKKRAKRWVNTKENKQILSDYQKDKQASKERDIVALQKEIKELKAKEKRLTKKMSELVENE